MSAATDDREPGLALLISAFLLRFLGPFAVAAGIFFGLLWLAQQPELGGVIAPAFGDYWSVAVGWVAALAALVGFTASWTFLAGVLG